MADRAKGVVLSLLVLDDLGDAALVKFNESRTDEEPATSMRVGWAPYAVLVRGDRLWVVSHEGVGGEVTDDKPLEIDLYAQWGEHKFSMMPSAVAVLDREEVLARTSPTETVDLSEHVRSFGRRLEENFWSWHALATVEVPA